MHHSSPTKQISVTISLLVRIVHRRAPSDDKARGLLGMNSSVLGIFGREDKRPGPEQALDFDSSVEETIIDYNVTVYNGMGHVFCHSRSASKRVQSSRCCIG